jgi:hypothetical protein
MFIATALPFNIRSSGAKLYCAPLERSEKTLETGAIDIARLTALRG